MTGIFMEGGKGQPARKAGKLTVICEPTVQRKCGSFDVSQPYGLSRTVTGVALSFFFYLYDTNPQLIH
jgi:hypothetical protein